MKCVDNMCKECPFKKDAIPGYFGQRDNEKYAEDVLAMFQGEKPFPCHELVDEETSFDAVVRGDIPLCKGYISMYAASLKQPRDLDLMGLVQEVNKAEKGSVLKSWEFLKYHLGSN